MELTPDQLKSVVTMAVGAGAGCVMQSPGGGLITMPSEDCLEAVDSLLIDQFPAIDWRNIR